MDFLKKILGIFNKSGGGNEYNLGILFHESDEKIPKFNEIVAKANQVEWKEIDINKLPQYTVRNQDGSSSCVAFSMNLLASVLYQKRTGNAVDFSPRWTYSKRFNKPKEGMWAYDAFNIAANDGFLLEDILKSDNLGEVDMNSPVIYPWYKDVAAPFRLDKNEPISLPVGDIDAVASVIQTTKKPVMVWFNFGSGEWNKVVSLSSKNAEYAHSVVAIDYGMYQGKKCLVIQDSWGLIDNTFSGKRIIPEDFYAKRNLFAGYPMRFKFDANTDKPHYDGSVKSLQDCLKYEGLFPGNVDSTGVFGTITTNAVKAFQAKYGLAQVGTVGPLTTKKLEELY